VTRAPEAHADVVAASPRASSTEDAPDGRAGAGRRPDCAGTTASLWHGARGPIPATPTLTSCGRERSDPERRTRTHNR
jgi:hypothetical protein